ncbi:MAG: hypothetical protein ACPGR7_05060 [Flavobacteriaceae bacterium]
MKQYSELLKNLKSFRDQREELAELANSDAEFRIFCYKSLQNNDDLKIQSRAAWVLDIALEKQIELFLDEVKLLIPLFQQVLNDGTLRCLLRMLSHLSQYENKNDIQILNPTQREELVNFSFDILISNELVAAKVHAMEILFQQENKFDWVKSALREELQNKILGQSPAYQARAKKILKN